MYGDLTIILPTVTSAKPSNFRKALEFQPSGKGSSEIQGCLFEAIVGEIVVKPPYKSRLHTAAGQATTKYLTHLSPHMSPHLTA